MSVEAADHAARGPGRLRSEVERDGVARQPGDSGWNRFPPRAFQGIVRAVSTTVKTKRPARERAATQRKKALTGKFWTRSASRELDRTGDFILKNLARMRKEAASRAGAA